MTDCKYIKQSALARRWGLSAPAVKEAVRHYGLPFLKLKRSVLIEWDAVLRFESDRKQVVFTEGQRPYA